MLRPGSCYIVAEIGINHNGNVEIAKELMRVAHAAGCDAVKFQKRTIELVYTPEQLARPRESPYGSTYGDAKRALEFGRAEYDEIDAYARELGIDWYASPLDPRSVDFLMRYDVPYIKISSGCATDKDLLRYCAATGKPLLISTGMCDLPLIRCIVDHVIQSDGQIGALYLCTSTYPCPPEELNLLGLQTLKRAFPGIPIGYSGHETGVPTSVMAATLGAASVERHVTLDRTLPGTDHAASLEPPGLQRLVRDIRLWERARGDGVIRISRSEVPHIERLRLRDSFRPDAAERDEEPGPPRLPLGL